MRRQKFIVKLSVVTGLAMGSVVGPIGPHAVAAPTPVTFCNFVATTDVKLTEDLTCNGTPAIRVGNHDIAIDLGGYTLTGNLSAGNHGIRNTGGFDNVTVRNGTVKKFEDGIHAEAGADGMRVEDVVASGNTSSGIEIYGDFAQIRSSQASANEAQGVYIAGASSRVISSEASGNDDTGVAIFGNSARVTSSHASGNGFTGIFISGASAQVRSSKASGNAVHGIEIFGNSPKIGQTAGRPASHRNHAHANGFESPNSLRPGLGIFAYDGNSDPVGVGRNVARGNYDPAECDPSHLC